MSKAQDSQSRPVKCNKSAGRCACRNATIYTNHSGKVTCATELFAHNVDEQLIMRQTGHHSSAVRAYKRPGVAHDMLVSAILQPPKKSKLDDEQCVLPSG